mmetsp:Transcript_107010/g.201605  ORF Transcript_107010/g.201605 Transcript_107010/m.201605 type:complete len:500 (+) Transcript_107010:77-1576(+)
MSCPSRPGPKEVAALTRSFGRKSMAHHKSRGSRAQSGTNSNGNSSVSATRPEEASERASPASKRHAEGPRPRVADAAWQPKLRPLDEKLAQCLGKQAGASPPSTPSERSRKVGEQSASEPQTPSNRKGGSETLRGQPGSPKGLQKEVPAAVWSELMRTRFAAEDPQQALARIQLESGCRIHIDRHKKQVRIFGLQDSMQVAVQLLDDLAADCTEEVVALDEVALSEERLLELDHLAQAYHVTIRAETARLVVLGHRPAVAEALPALDKIFSQQEIDGQCASNTEPASSVSPVNVENFLSLLTSKYQADFTKEPPRQLAEATREALMVEIAEGLHVTRCQGSDLGSLGDAPWNKGYGGHVDMVAAWSVMRPACVWTPQSWEDALGASASSQTCMLLICHVMNPNMYSLPADVQSGHDGHMVACRISPLGNSAASPVQEASRDAQYYVIASHPNVRPLHVVSLTRNFSGSASTSAAWVVESWYDVHPMQKMTSEWSFQTGY